MVVRCCSGAVVRWCGGAVVRWCGGVVVWWCGGAVVCGGGCGGDHGRRCPHRCLVVDFAELHIDLSALNRHLEPVRDTASAPVYLQSEVLGRVLGRVVCAASQ